MKFPVVIKPSSFLLVLRIVEVEIFVSGLLFLASFFANYEQIYKSFSLTSAIRYDIFVFIAGAFLQLFITVAVFLIWNKEEYRLKEKEVLRRHGIFFTQEHSLLLKNIVSVEYKQSLLESWFGCGTIAIWPSNSDKAFYIRTIDQAEIYTSIIKDALDLALNAPIARRDRIALLDMILEGEHAKLEFKQTLRFDFKKQMVNKDLEKAVMKTIAAFLNFEGGTLVVGVSDGGKVTGLSDDYQQLIRKDRDGFENHFNQVFRMMIGAEFRQYVSVSFESFDDKDVCVIDVVKSPKPVYVKTNNEEEFFIRTGNATSPLKMSQVSSYIESHWGKGV